MIKYLEKWLDETGARAPILLVGSAPTGITKKLRTGRKLEVITLPGDEKTISVEQLRTMMSQLNRKALAQRRLVVVPGVERLTMVAANAFLKTLEECADETRFLLLTNYPRRLPATVLSRCQRINVRGSRVDESLADEWAAQLVEKLRVQGPSGQLRLAWQRWRDYYQIRELGGNAKLAKEVLLAYLPPERA